MWNPHYASDRDNFRGFDSTLDCRGWLSCRWRGEERVERGLHHGVGHRLGHVEQRCAEFAQRLEHLHAGVRISTVHAADNGHRAVVMTSGISGAAGKVSVTMNAVTSSGAVVT
jgi:hypothetical protein